MNGQDLVDFINRNEWLKLVPIKHTIMELLKRSIINPSEIIDAHTQVLNEKCDRYRSHYEDSCVSALQLFGGSYKDKDYETAKNRFLYNASFSEYFPGLIGNELTPENRKYWREFFKKTYGIDPEIK